jgi:hypothetical protein
LTHPRPLSASQRGGKCRTRIWKNRNEKLNLITDLVREARKTKYHRIDSPPAPLYFVKRGEMQNKNFGEKENEFNNRFSQRA